MQVGDSWEVYIWDVYEAYQQRPIALDSLREGHRRTIA